MLRRCPESKYFGQSLAEIKKKFSDIDLCRHAVYEVVRVSMLRRLEEVEEVGASREESKHL